MSGNSERDSLDLCQHVRTPSREDLPAPTVQPSGDKPSLEATFAHISVFHVCIRHLDLPPKE